MSEQAVKEWPEIELWRDPLRPDLGPRFGLDFESPTEGFPELMRYIPQQRVNALVEALEEIGDRMCGDAQCWACQINAALANYKEGEA